MRVLITHFSLNFRGGAEEVCLNIIKALKEVGHHVTLLTVDKTVWNELKDRFGIDVKPDSEIYVTRSCIHRNMGMHALAARFTSFALNVLRLKLCGEFDLILNTYGDLDVLIPLSDISYVGLPFTSCVAYPSASPTLLSSFLHLKLYSSMSRLFNKIANTLRRNAPLILTNSSFTKKIIENHLGYKALILHPPVNVEMFAKCWRPWRERDNVVITIARFTKGKRLEIVPLIARYVNAKFIIVGSTSPQSSPLLEELKKLSKGLRVDDKILLLPNLSENELCNIMSRAKVYLHTMPYEPFGISIVKAMASGLVPVVPRRSGSYLDVIQARDGIYGFGYEGVEDAARHINIILQNEGVGEEISRRVRERAKSFNFNSFKSKLLNIIESFVSARPG